MATQVIPDYKDFASDRQWELVDKSSAVAGFYVYVGVKRVFDILGLAARAPIAKTFL